MLLPSVCTILHIKRQILYDKLPEVKLTEAECRMVGTSSWVDKEKQNGIILI
jgi:hypothetical protein